MDFKNAKELLTLCQDHQLPISEIMRQREIIVGETTDESVNSRMARVLEIMKDAAFSPVKTPVRSFPGILLPVKGSVEMSWKKQSPTQWRLWRQTLPWD